MGLCRSNLLPPITDEAATRRFAGGLCRYQNYYSKKLFNYNFSSIVDIDAMLYGLVDAHALQGVPSCGCCGLRIGDIADARHGRREVVDSVLAIALCCNLIVLILGDRTDVDRLVFTVALVEDDVERIVSCVNIERMIVPVVTVDRLRRCHLCARPGAEQCAVAAGVVPCVEVDVAPGGILQVDRCRVWLKGLDDVFKGPTAVGYSDDIIAPAKILAKYSEDIEPMEIKGGIIDGKVASVDEVVALSKVPDPTTLQTQVAYSLLFPFTKLAMLVKAVAEKKQEEGGEAPAAAPAAEEVKAEAEAPAEAAAPAETPAE